MQMIILIFWSITFYLWPSQIFLDHEKAACLRARRVLTHILMPFWLSRNHVNILAEKMLCNHLDLKLPCIHNIFWTVKIIIDWMAFFACDTRIYLTCFEHIVLVYRLILYALSLCDISLFPTQGHSILYKYRWCWCIVHFSKTQKSDYKSVKIFEVEWMDGCKLSRLA